MRQIKLETCVLKFLSVSVALIVSCGVVGSLNLGRAIAQEAQWVWSGEHRQGRIPQRAACHFRKDFIARNPQDGQIEIRADDSYEIWVNGRRVGRRDASNNLDRYDISRFLQRGRNVVAVSVLNRRGNTAGLVARVQVQENQGKWVNHSTNDTWRTNLRPLPLWHLPIYNDSGWPVAASFGKLGSTATWDGAGDARETARATTPEQDAQQQVASTKTNPRRVERFTISDEFDVHELVTDDQSGSLIALSFNEFGQVIAARENGPLLIMTDTDKDKLPDKVQVYCDKVKNCQGILALNGHVYVTADGPDGAALYKLSDKDRDGEVDAVRAMLEFKGEMGEHGAHGLVLGPDGMIYVILGNHTSPTVPYETDSPHKHFYEGDLFPRYEDPGGHANGVRAPGGVVLRADVNFDRVELVAGGLRNAYDLAFNQHGDLFTYDSDMESDMGMTWYRPTRVYQIVEGGEYGWRSGWSKWPDYFVDSLPGILDTGRGSPTGVTIYSHIKFPKRYHGAMFLGDWSEGRILVSTLERSGGSYAAKEEVFMEGQPLNVTDLEIGPDGALYFITGGRGTGGGLYRVSWRGTVPTTVKSLGSGMSRVIRQPQIQSAWARQAIAAERVKIGDKWDKQLLGVAGTAKNPPHYRLRALEVMQWFGPLPPEDLLIKLSRDESPAIRAKATYLMGLHSSQKTQAAVLRLLEDSDAGVRRRALEALLRSDEPAPIDKILASLGSKDKFEAWAARKVLENQDVRTWRDKVLTSQDHRVFNAGAIALLAAHPSKENASDVISRLGTLIGGYVTDENFLDMLRVAQVALLRGNIKPAEVPKFREQLADEFPSSSSHMNRELARLLAYLQVASIADRYLEYFQLADVSKEDKVHLAIHLRFISEGWTIQQRIELLKFLEQAVQWDGGGSYGHYVMNASRDFAKSLSGEDVVMVLDHGDQWPNAALGALYKLPTKLDGGLFHYVKRLDAKVTDREDESVERLKVGIVAVLARSGDPQSLEYLREIWRRDPERRGSTAMALAQHPQGENWDYLVRSIPILEDEPAREVLLKLTSVNYRPEEAEYYRYVILRGLELKQNGAHKAIALLKHWTGEEISETGDSWKVGMSKWQQWYAKTYPYHPPAELPAAENNKWDFDELLEHLDGEGGAQGSAERGEAVFAKATCNKCHRLGTNGESMGPDLTTISKRFTRKEILESVLFPSHVIPDQYASKSVITVAGKLHVGIVAAGTDGELVVLDADAKKTTIAKDDVEEIVPNKNSAMPEGLLNELTIEEIADLFAYLGVAPKLELAERPETTTK